MKKLFKIIFDFIFPRRPNDAVIADISPADFYAKMPRWNEKIHPNNMGFIFHYRHSTVKAMIKELKSDKNEHAARIAAHALANFFEENDIRDAIIIPMPISRKRRRKRGYNQCEFLAEFFVREVLKREKTTQGIESNNLVPRTTANHFEIRTDILEKPIDTPKLALQDREARLKANKGVFKTRCTLSHIKRRIIVIDDVITTGSTMHSAMETLRAGGGKNIFGISIAH